MKFFVPGAADPEAKWEQLRAIAAEEGNGVSRRRVYSIEFDHDGEQLTARVGERMVARRYVRSPRSRRGELERGSHHSGTVIVAIFEGNPWMVWLEGRGGGWNNPFKVGNPGDIVDFEP